MGGHYDKQRNQNEGPDLHREGAESRGCKCCSRINLRIMNFAVLLTSGYLSSQFKERKEVIVEDDEDSKLDALMNASLEELDELEVNHTI